MGIVFYGGPKIQQRPKSGIFWIGRIKFISTIHSPSVRNQTTHRASNMLIDLENLFNTTWLDQLTSDPLLDNENNTFTSLDTDCGRTELDSFDRVFNLEKSTFWTERVDTSVVFGSGAEHFGGGVEVFLISENQ